MRCARLALARWLALGAGGCARAAQPDPLAGAFRERGVARARQLAPDLVGRAQQARREAAAASDVTARSAARERAELWLEAAIVEAARIDAERAAAAAEARTAVADQRRASVLAEHAELQRVRALEAAGRAARARAERMLAGGGLVEAAERGDAAALADATAFALERATLLLAAARALGFEAALAEALDARLASLASHPTARATGSEASKAAARSRLRALLEALPEFERALGAARLTAPGPTPEERASLQADAAERGLALELQPQGVVVALAAPAFATTRAEPGADGKRWLAQLAALLRLHPRGPVEVQHGSSALAARRAAIVSARLRAGAGELRPVPPADPSLDPDRVAVVLRAYGPAVDSSVPRR